jgi:hypothetical protein
MKQHNRTTGRWVLAAAGLIFVLTLVAAKARAEIQAEVIVGHWSYHWIGENVTNNKHALICLRVEWAIGCRFNNSYKQEGFSGESYALGLVKDWTLAEDINRWGGDITLMGSLGAMYGYTKFMGHDPDGDKKIYGYIAPGLFYRQPFGPGDSYWKAGVLQFGAASVPSVSLGATF